MPMPTTTTEWSTTVIGDLDRAIADYDRNIEVDPHSANAYYSRGLAHFDKGDLDQAVADYD